MELSLNDSEQNRGHDLRANVTASVQFTLLIVVLFLSLLENLFLFLVSFSSVYRWCRSHYLKRQYRNAVNLTGYPNKLLRKGGTLNERVPSRLRSECEEFGSNELFANAYQKCSTPPYEPSSENDVNHASQAITNSSDRIGNVTRHYFGNLCLANLLLALLAMPFSIAASIGTTTKPAYMHILENMTWSLRKLEHHDNIMLNYPLIISTRMCAFIESVVCGILITTVYSLVQLTADRLLAICLPLHYSRIVTRRRALISIFLVWFASGLFVSITHLLSLLPGSHAAHGGTMDADSETDIYRCFILGQHDKEKHWKMAISYFILVFLLPFIFIAVAYIKIYRTVRRCLKQLTCGTHSQPDIQGSVTLSRSHSSAHSLFARQDVNRNQNSTVTSPDTSKVPKSFIRRTHTFDHCSTKDTCRPKESIALSRQHRRQKVQTKAAKTACMLVATFFLLTAPYFIFTVIEPFLHIHSSVMHEEAQDEMIETISSIIVWLLYVNSVLTPGLYALRDGVLRRRIASIWFLPTKKRSSFVGRSTVE